jgi:hypothetical protein
LDLNLFVMQLQNNGHAILLAGDFNEALNLEMSEMTRLTSDRNLVELMYFVFSPW